MKKILSLFIAFIVLLMTVTSCTQNHTNTPDEGTSSKGETVTADATPEAFLGEIEQVLNSAESYTLVSSTKSNDADGNEILSFTSTFSCTGIGKETYKDSTTSVLKTEGTTLTRGEGFQNGYMYKTTNGVYTHSPIELAEYLRWTALQNEGDALQSVDFSSCDAQRFELKDDVWTLSYDDIGEENTAIFSSYMALDELLGTEIGTPHIGMTIEADSTYTNIKVLFEFLFDQMDIPKIHVNIELTDLNQTTVETLDFKKLNSVESVDFRVIESVSNLFAQLYSADEVELSKEYTFSEKIQAEHYSGQYQTNGKIKVNRQNGLTFDISTKDESGETRRETYEKGRYSDYLNDSLQVNQKMTVAQAEAILFETVDPYKFSLNHVLDIRKVSPGCFEFDLPQSLMKHLTDGLRVTTASAVMQVVMDDYGNIVSYEYIFNVAGNAGGGKITLRENQKITIKMIG